MTKKETQKLEEMHTDIKWIKCTLTKHLSNHTKWAITIAGLLGAVLSGCLVNHFTH